MSRIILLSFAVVILCVQNGRADDPVFSGPQVGEKLAPFEAKGVFGDLDGKKFDLIKRAEKKSVALIFVHARTRPAFGLTNLVMKYAATRAKAGLESGVIFLTEDLTATEAWMRQVERHFPKGVVYGLSTDGAEGPGAYGLNRNVTLTVLIGKEGKATANFALVQPSIQADGPKILKAIVDVTGGGKVPIIADLAGPRYRGQAKKKAPARKTDPKFTGLLRSVINKQVSEDDVSKAAAELEKYVEKNEAARKELGRIASTVVNSGKLSNYGTEAAQKKLKEWEREYGAKPKEVKKDKPDDKASTDEKKKTEKKSTDTVDD
jgi:hypothetical protein